MISSRPDPLDNLPATPEARLPNRKERRANASIYRKERRRLVAQMERQARRRFEQVQAAQQQAPQDYKIE